LAITKDQIAGSLVKEILSIPDYPGYKYVYFSNFAELDEYFTSTMGKDWKNQRWAQVYLYSEEIKKPRGRRQQHVKTGIRDVIRKIYEDAHYNISMNQVHRRLLMLNYKISWETARVHCKKVLSERRHDL
jgi:hypothetical protein